MELRSALCVLRECTHFPMKNLVLSVKLRFTALGVSDKGVKLVPFRQAMRHHVPHAPVVRIVKTIASISVHLDSLV